MDYRRAIDAAATSPFWPHTVAAEMESVHGLDLRAILIGLDGADGDDCAEHDDVWGGAALDSRQFSD